MWRIVKGGPDGTYKQYFPFGTAKGCVAGAP